MIHSRFLDLITCLDDGGRSLSGRMRHIVLGGAALHVAEMVVEGYSRIRRTGENTPLIMSNDVSTLKTSLEHLSKMRPFPYMEHVQDFSRAFFLDLESSDMVIEWAKQHTNYPPHRISGELAQAQPPPPNVRSHRTASGRWLSPSGWTLYLNFLSSGPACQSHVQS
jgi:hypothetical protein